MSTTNETTMRLLAQEAMRLSGEHFKDAEGTPNLSTSTLNSLSEKGLGELVKLISKLRDNLTHKRILPPLTSSEVSQIERLLPVMKEIVGSELVEL